MLIIIWKQLETIGFDALLLFSNCWCSECFIQVIFKRSNNQNSLWLGHFWVGIVIFSKRFLVPIIAGYRFHETERIEDWKNLGWPSLKTVKVFEDVSECLTHSIRKILYRMLFFQIRLSITTVFRGTKKLK